MNILSLEKAIEKSSYYLRPELKRNLRLVLQKPDQIISFADRNIDLVIRGNFPKEIIDLVPLCFSAVYFANAYYFGYDVCEDSEHVTITATSEEGPATHEEMGLYDHDVRITKDYLDSFVSLFLALDAESRHAVHQNILQERDLFEGNLAERAFNVIAETVDEGEHEMVITRSPHYDPFLDDFRLADGEDSGHNGAKYLCRHLSPNPINRRQQLYWLSRLAIRSQDQSSPHNDHEIIPSAGTKSPYTTDISFLERFYTDQLKPSGPKSKRMLEIRKNILQGNPYSPNDTVDVYGRTISQFVSQLDYVALKLAHTPPEKLSLSRL